MIVTLGTIVKARDLFDSLGKEEGNIEEREIEISEGSLEKLTKAFQIALKTKEAEKSMDDMISAHKHGSVDRFFKVCEGLSPLKYSSKDINNLVQVTANQIVAYDELPRNIVSNLGLFISALINNSEEQDHLINVPFVGSFQSRYFTEVPFLGYRNNGKSLLIKGYAHPGNHTGSLMESGEIKIETELDGDSNCDLGEWMKGGNLKLKVNRLGRHYHVGRSMEGGKIEVEGIVCDIGGGMKGGSIYLKGSVYHDVGYCMAGGEIYIDGDCARYEEFGSKASPRICDDMSGGKVTINGEIHGTPAKKMSGGELHVNSKKAFRLSSSATGGDIYRNGKLIMQYGRKVK